MSFYAELNRPQNMQTFLLYVSYATLLVKKNVGSAAKTLFAHSVAVLEYVPSSVWWEKAQARTMASHNVKNRRRKKKKAYCTHHCPRMMLHKHTQHKHHKWNKYNLVSGTNYVIQIVLLGAQGYWSAPYGVSVPIGWPCVSCQYSCDFIWLKLGDFFVFCFVLWRGFFFYMLGKNMLSDEFL